MVRRGQPALRVVGGHIAKWSMRVVLGDVAGQQKGAELRSLGRSDSPGSLII